VYLALTFGEQPGPRPGGTIPPSASPRQRDALDRIGDTSQTRLRITGLPVFLLNSPLIELSVP